MSGTETDQFRADVVAGLAAVPRAIPCKYLYDARGSSLFEAICATDEYYVTRADLALHETHLPEIARRIGPDAHVIEFGSGAGIKTRRLLEALQSPRAYTPIEISAEALDRSANALEKIFPDIRIRPIQGDYTLPVPESAFVLDPPARRRVVYFPGSTISNFAHDEAAHFLARMARIAGAGGAVLIGVDLLKPVAQLIAAYNDSAGITAAFNLNLLERVKRELGAELEPGAFRHEARYNRKFRRIEMYLVAVHPTRIRLGGHEFTFDTGETIHTENSHKYSVADFRRLARQAGLNPVKVWKDPEGLFSMHLLEPG